MTSHDLPTDPIGACTVSLLRDLAELDFNTDTRSGPRSLLLKSAIESIAYLERLGGGSLGLAAIKRVRRAVFVELERFAGH